MRPATRSIRHWSYAEPLSRNSTFIRLRLRTCGLLCRLNVPHCDANPCEEQTIVVPNCGGWGGWPRSSTAAARDLVRPEPCDWATDPRGRRIGPVFALHGLCDAPFSTMDLEYFHGLSRHVGWPRSLRANARRSARPRPPRLGTALYRRWECCSPSLTVEDAAFDFEIQHGDTRETAISSPPWTRNAAWVSGLLCKTDYTT